MVNIHITGDKSLFQSKNAITRLKNKIRELGDPQLIESDQFLKENYEFKFKEQKDDIFVEIQEKHYLWGDNTPQSNNQVTNKSSGRDKLKARLQELRNKRLGIHAREMHSIKKSVDKSIFKKYAMITQMVPNFPLPKPNELLDNPEKHKQEIQMFSSGLVQLTQNPKIDGLVTEYFKEISEKVGYEILSKEEIDKLMEQNMPQAPKKEEQLPASINLNSYVDSDTESDDSDVSDVEMEEDNKKESSNTEVDIKTIEEEEKDVVV